MKSCFSLLTITLLGKNDVLTQKKLFLLYHTCLQENLENFDLIYFFLGFLAKI